MWFVSLARGLKDPSRRWNLFFHLPLLDVSSDQTGFAAAAWSTAIVSKSVTSTAHKWRKWAGWSTHRRRHKLASYKGRRREEDGQHHEGLTVLASPETDVRSAPLTRTLPFPCTGLLWRINIKSSPWYPYCIIRRCLRPKGDADAENQNCYLAQFYIFCSTPTSTEGGYRQTRNVMLDFRQFSLSERKQHSALDELHRSLAPKFNLPSGSSFAG